MTHLDFFPVDWTCGDVDVPGAKGRRECRVTACGKTPEGVEVCVHATFTPFFYVAVPPTWSEARTRSFVAETAAAHGGVMSRCVPVHRKSAWGFDGGRRRAMAQLAFPTLAAARRARKTLARKHDTFEAAVDPILRVLHLRDLAPAGWVRVAAGKHVDVPDAQRTSRCRREVACSFDALSACPDPPTTPPPLVVASYDIEVMSSTGAFPLAERPGDHVIQISTTFQRFGEPAPYRRTVVCLHDTAPVDGVDIVSCVTEAEVFDTWAGLVREERADVLVDWNGSQFDMKYLHGRSMVCIDDATGDSLFDLGAMGRMKDGGGEPVERSLSSSAYGQNKFFDLATPGVLHLDLLQWFRKNRSLDSYSLQNVSTVFLGDAKLDLPASEIFAKFEGTPEDRADIARYAVKDTELPLRLLDKLKILPDLFEMANAVKIPVSYVSERGQQIRVFSALVGKARQLGFVLPDDKGLTPDGKFQGATVLEPKRGAYFSPVAALDFASCEYGCGGAWLPFVCRGWLLDCIPNLASLHKLPSVISLSSFAPSCSVSKHHEVRISVCHGKRRDTHVFDHPVTPVLLPDSCTFSQMLCRASNLSFDTLVMDEAAFGALPGVEYETVETSQGSFRFAQPGPDGAYRGILPALLDDLAVHRKAAKKEMAAAKARGDDWAYALYNA